MNKFRKERYIKQIENKNGWSFQVRYKGKSKFFNEKDFLTPREAYNQAVKYRNNLLNIDIPVLVPYTKGIYDVMIESFDLLVIRQKTRLNHISFFNRYIQDNILLSNFNENFVYSKLNAMVESCTDDVIHRVFNIFSRIDRTALIKKYYDKSVMMSVVAPKSHINYRKTFKEPITRDELDKVISACSSFKSEYDRVQFPLILEFFYQTGCRPCEVWCLTWNDIGKSHISINKEVGSDNNNLNVIRSPKTSLSNRSIPITPKIRTLLKKAKNVSKCDLVFPNENGKMYETDLIGQRFKKIAKKVDVSFNLYDLRHRFATDLTLNLVDDRTKMELMGHKNLSMTLDYARSNDNKKISALKDRM